MSKKICEKCGGNQILDGKPCPALSVTALGRLACKLSDGTFDVKAENRSILNARMQKDKAYLERNKVVAALATAVIRLGGKAGLARTKIPGWNPAWHGCVRIQPVDSEQWSWHFHEDHAWVFAHLSQFVGEWDGHETPEKYRRLHVWATGKEPPKKEEEVEA